MKWHHSLRSRVAAGISVLVIVVLAIQGIAVYTAVDRQEEELMNRIVSDELAHYITRYRADPTTEPPALERFTGYLLRSAAERQSMPEVLRGLPPGLSEIHIGGDEHHVAVRDEPEGRFVMTYNVGDHEARERHVIALLVSSGIAAALLAGALGHWVAGYVVRPMTQFADRVEAASVVSGVAHLPADSEDQEIRRLTRAFSNYSSRVADFVQREQEFTANISHELRTPLTAIRTGCELLLLREGGLTPAGRERVEGIDRAAARLAETARSLLYLARGAEAPRLEEVSVAESVIEVAEPMLPALRAKGIDLQVAVEPSAMVRVDRTALLLVTDNLLRNAAAYTERGRIEVSYRAGCLAIEDTGPGIDPALLPRLGERFQRGAREQGLEGTGLGLSIVKRICERLGWRFEIGAASSGGTRVEIRFPAPTSREIHAASTAS
jgi:signal transduction histidine kinase